LHRRSSKKQIRTRPETLEFAKYVVVFTTRSIGSAEEILQLYRMRRQIELAFKRLKSLAQLGHLPKYDGRSSCAWLSGKLFVALLAQKTIRVGRDISPSGTTISPCPIAQSSARIQLRASSDPERHRAASPFAEDPFYLE
jgi:IS4 transposase